LLRSMSWDLALGGKSLHCNNFGSYVWLKRRGERVDFMREFDPQEPSCMRPRYDATIASALPTTLIVWQSCNLLRYPGTQ